PVVPHVARRRERWRAHAAYAVMKQRLTLDALNTAPAGEFVTALANVFEHSPWIAEAAQRARPFERLADLRDAMTAVLDQAPPELRLGLIRAHPDLANRSQ